MSSEAYEKLDSLTLAAATVERPATFAERVAETERRVFQIAYGVLGDAAEAEDTSQEAYLCAFRRFHRLRDPGKFRAWISRIVLRLALNQRRTRNRRQTRDTAWHAENPAAERPNGQDAADSILLTRLRAEIDRLPKKLRSVLLLSALEGMDSGEVAAVLEIPVGTVRSRLHTARKRLLEVMSR